MNTDLSKLLNRPLSVGNKSVEKRLILAPMTYLGHIAFREMVSKYGGFGLLFTEMCSAKRIPYENREVSPFFKWRDEELPYLVCQIFGADAEIMATAARRIEKQGFFGIDINFGCSVSSICRQNCGAALLKFPELAAQIVASVRKAVSFPVFVKFRTGWKDDPQIAIDMAKRFQDAGADALTFHPRVAPDRRARPPKWEYIRMVKESVSVPVFGNGNVFDHNDCRNMLQTTACDGIAIGRLAIAKPWIFAKWSDGYDPGADIYLSSAIQLAKLLIKHYDPKKAIRRFRKFTLYFSANFCFGHTLYNKVLNAKDMEEAEDMLYRFFENPPDLASKPNMNFFV
ncbi:tRNA dihydrouridine synthase [Desulfonema magnum]|uniref:tRNA-dihydrouridine synthase n=1 Tax=Desulfonema magnum TaxID=45655 RepID=A0A975BQ95_9BACT|nr:tRNA-dihydrouridine synthase family protein [Desulfonema magnum]QTA89214.1 putative tRNA-dihydrouridine synthase [Desulfonema magnum]